MSTEVVNNKLGHSIDFRSKARTNHQTESSAINFSASMDGLKVARRKSVRSNRRSEVNLANSAYERNHDAISEVASGSSMLGNSQSEVNKMQSLAKLLGNKNAFEQAFNTSRESEIIGPKK